MQNFLACLSRKSAFSVRCNDLEIKNSKVVIFHQIWTISLSFTTSPDLDRFHQEATMYPRAESDPLSRYKLKCQRSSCEEPLSL